MRVHWACPASRTITDLAIQTSEQLVSVKIVGKKLALIIWRDPRAVPIVASRATAHAHNWPGRDRQMYSMLLYSFISRYVHARGIMCMCS